MFENLFRNVASLAYLVGIALLVIGCCVVAVVTDAEPEMSWAQTLFLIFVAFLCFMTARSAGETFGTAVDLHWTKVAIAQANVESKAQSAQDDGNPPA